MSNCEEDLAHNLFLEACDDSDFEDACDEDDEEIQSASTAQLPTIVPTGAQVLSEMNAIRKAFESEHTVGLPLTAGVLTCRDAMLKDAAPLFAFSRLLAEDQKHAIWSLYGVVCKFNDAKTFEELNDVRSRLRRVFNADIPVDSNTDDVWNALRATLKRYSVMQRPFEGLADGIVKHPAKGFAFATIVDLLSYAYRGAGVAGLIALPVLAEHAALDEQVVEAAIALGIALKLTDMLNCIGHHQRTLGFCWIPRECLERHKVSETELLSNLQQTSSTLVGNPRWKSIMQELLAIVPPLLQRATRGGEMLPNGARLAVRTAVRMCSRMVLQIEDRDYNSIGPHQEMFSWRMVADVAGAMWAPEAPKKPKKQGGTVSI